MLIKGFATHNNTKGWIEEDHMLSTGAAESGEARLQDGRARAEGRRHRADLRLLHLHGADRSSRTTASARRARAARSSRSGALRMGGALPTNTSGGQLSEAHVEGMLQIVEGARQMQGIYGAGAPGRRMPRSR